MTHPPTESLQVRLARLRASKNVKSAERIKRAGWKTDQPGFLVQVAAYLEGIVPDLTPALRK